MYSGVCMYSIVSVCTHVHINILFERVFAYVWRAEKPRQPQADIWLTCPADPLRLFVTQSLWESMWLRLLPLLSRCDCFVTKDDSQSDICRLIHMCVHCTNGIRNPMHEPHIQAVHFAKLCQVLTGCKTL